MIPKKKTQEFSAVVIANHQRFLAFLKTRVESPEAAEEILQSAYVKGLKKSGTLRDKEKIIAWFYRLLRNALYDHYRRKGAEARALQSFAVESEGKREAMERDLERTVCKCVTALVGTLKPEYSKVLKKAEIESQSIKELAAKEKVTPTNLSVRLHRARHSLKQKVLETCGACARHGCLDCSCKH